MKIFISTLEPSGDVLCTGLITEMKLQHKDICFYGIGGPKMENIGVQLIERPLTQLSSLGVINNLFNVPKYMLAIKKSLQWIKQNNPEKVILCDSRFFNLKLAQELRKQGYSGTIVYYIAPVTWQSLYDPKYITDEKHLKRFIAIKQYCDFAILAYPVSLEIYKKLEIKHYFFGHPLSSLCRANLSRAQFCSQIGINPKSKLISIFPGIRPSEYNLIAPILNKVALELIKQGLSVACDVSLSVNNNEIITVPSELHFDLIEHSEIVISKSGTVIQECTLMSKPVICVYKIPNWQAWFARNILHFSMPYYSLPNLLSGMMIIPELFQEEFTKEKVFNQTIDLLDNKELYNKTVERLGKVKESIIGIDSVSKAAKVILDNN